ncbi:WecB/TagA/CpsF family glycosyltransferase [Crassaminicella indica]|uniref:N-acetylglucosaminyldiphosphoundecaprenol N-acetyl-beta-D-mannosaminyltransferase n=2 Tax=Crassaminicella indica TaxID=2855394 RepID=A0ABX8RG40_9CLOT|nr:WecB/TagA/CpsF family glycosyltransferase [Crassaminicella indica]
MGVCIDQGNLEDAYNRCIEFINTKGCKMIITPNTEIIMRAQKDSKLFQIINKADLVIPDGIGLIYASKIQGKGLKERVTGVDLMYKILEYCNENKKSIYILGGKPEVAEKACKNIKNKLPGVEIKGCHDGYFKEEEEINIIENINRLNPDILFVALGVPKQEIFMDKYKEMLSARIVMGVGGSVDVWAGTVKRAPKIYQKLGLEWFYRLLKEPWRYKRMMVLPKFMIKVLFQK